MSAPGHRSSTAWRAHRPRWSASHRRSVVGRSPVAARTAQQRPARRCRYRRFARRTPAWSARQLRMLRLPHRHEIPRTRNPTVRNPTCRNPTSFPSRPRIPRLRIQIPNRKPNPRTRTGTGCRAGTGTDAAGTGTRCRCATGAGRNPMPMCHRCRWTRLCPTRCRYRMSVVGLTCGVRRQLLLGRGQRAVGSIDLRLQVGGVHRCQRLAGCHRVAGRDIDSCNSAGDGERGVRALSGADGAHRGLCLLHRSDGRQCGPVGGGGITGLGDGNSGAGHQQRRHQPGAGHRPAPPTPGRPGCGGSGRRFLHRHGSAEPASANRPARRRQSARRRQLAQ